MKLLTYDIGTGPRAGVLDGSDILDATTLLGATNTLRDVRALLEFAPTAVERLRDALRRVPRASSRTCGRETPRAHPAATHRPRPHRLRGARHRAVDARPTTAHGSLGAPADLLLLQPAAHLWSRRGRAFPRGDAAAGLRMRAGGGRRPRRQQHPRSRLPTTTSLGFTIFNDWSCRDLQFDESAFGLGPAKGKDSASSLGPWIVTRDEMAPYYRNGTLHVQCTVRVNGVVWMEGNAWNMHHTFGAMIERAAQDSRIVPGDVIATGTVGGGSISEASAQGLSRTLAAARRRGGNRSRRHRHAAQSAGHAEVCPAAAALHRAQSTGDA